MVTSNDRRCLVAFRSPSPHDEVERLSRRPRPPGWSRPTRKNEVIAAQHATDETGEPSGRLPTAVPTAGTADDVGGGAAVFPFWCGCARTGSGSRGPGSPDRTISSTGRPCASWIPRSSSPNSAAGLGRCRGSADIARLMTPDTSSGTSCSRKVRDQLGGGTQELGDHLLATATLERSMPGNGAEQRRTETIDIGGLRGSPLSTSGR